MKTRLDPGENTAVSRPSVGRVLPILAGMILVLLVWQLLPPRRHVPVSRFIGQWQSINNPGDTAALKREPAMKRLIWIEGSEWRCAHYSRNRVLVSPQLVAKELSCSELDEKTAYLILEYNAKQRLLQATSPRFRVIRRFQRINR